MTLHGSPPAWASTVNTVGIIQESIENRPESLIILLRKEKESINAKEASHLQVSLAEGYETGVDLNGISVFWRL